MSARPRECWTEQGLPKRRYDTRAAAKATIRRYDNAACQPYRCEHCGYFHIGHYPTRDDARALLRRRHRTVAA